MLLGGGKRGPRVVRVLGKTRVARVVLEALMLDAGSAPELSEGGGGGGSHADGPHAWARCRGPARPARLATFTIDPDLGTRLR